LVQESELTESQRSIHEINFGAYVFDRDFMAETLPHLDKHPGGEYYLTDLVRVATEAGKTVESVSVPYPDEQMGINDAGQRERAEAFLAKLAGESRSQPVSS
jgi:bifunctional UDP-N-acetylglucosamine pyrophosphorylase/glucosamine-1-phosphate N-acetyltransferase